MTGETRRWSILGALAVVLSVAPFLGVVPPGLELWVFAGIVLSPALISIPFARIDLTILTWFPAWAAVLTALGLFGRLEGADADAVPVGLATLGLGLVMSFLALRRHLRPYRDPESTAPGSGAAAGNWKSRSGPLLLGILVAMALEIAAGGRLRGLTAGVGVAALFWWTFLPRLLRPWRRGGEGEPVTPGSSPFRQRVLELYDYQGPYVEQYLMWKWRLDPIYEGVDGLVPRSGRVVDLGCGYGLMSNILAERAPGRQVVGADFDAKKIRVARCTARGRENVRFEVRNVIEGSLPPSDVVVLVDMLHYWRAEVQAALIAKVCSSLSPGGVVVFREGLADESGGHRVVSMLERFSTAFGFNRKGEALHFQPRGFYIDAFARGGLALQAEHPELGRGSNRVLVFRAAGG